MKEKITFKISDFLLIKDFKNHVIKYNENDKLKNIDFFLLNLKEQWIEKVKIQSFKPLTLKCQDNSNSYLIKNILKNYAIAYKHDENNFLNIY